jgi:hypothetical protein
MNDERQKTQRNKSFSAGSRSEAPNPAVKATESIIAECKPKNPTGRGEFN